MHEQNTWGVLVVGGGLCTLNVLLTSYRMERILTREMKGKAEMSTGSNNTKETPHRTQVYVGDVVSIDIDSLSEEKDLYGQTENHRFLGEGSDMILRQYRKSRKPECKHRDRKHSKSRRDRTGKGRVQEPDFGLEDGLDSRKYRSKRKSKSRASKSGMGSGEFGGTKGKKLKKKSQRKAKVRMAEKDTIIGL